MISTSIGGDAILILPYQPDWSARVQMRFESATDAQRSLTGREVRRPLGVSLRTRIQYSMVLGIGELAAIRDAMAAGGDRRVLVPAWPFVVAGTDWAAAPVKGGLVLAWNDGWGSYAINPSTPADWDWVAPAILGREEIEMTDLVHPDLADVGVVLTEESPGDQALLPAAVAWSPGPALNDDSVPVICPFRLDWTTRPRSGLPDIEVVRSRIGAAPRLQVSEVYPQNPAHAFRGRVGLHSRDEVAQMLRWWADRRGDVEAHYVSTFTQVCGLTAAAGAGATSIAVDDASRLGDYRFLALHSLGGMQVVRAGDPVGNSVPVVGGLPVAVDPRDTFVAIAALARHARPTLEVTFEGPLLASCELAWEEVREEYIIPDLVGLPAEGRGTTMGAAAVRGWLYTITVDRGTSQTVYRRTSYERDVTVGPNTWTAVPINHGEIRRSIQLDRDQVTLEGGVEEWVTEFLPGRLSGRVLLEISECSVSGGTGSSVVARWSGEIGRVSIEGAQFRAVGSGIFGAFDEPAPRPLIQPGCNHSVYDGGCGLDIAAWTFAAEVHSSSGSQVTLKTWSRSGGLPDGWGFADYFALGYVTRTDPLERYAVLRSTAVSGGLVTLTLERSAAWVADEAVTVVPGCDGRAETCRGYHASTNPEGKFGNYPRFGGFPFVPAKNPAFTPPRRTNSSYGKK